MGHRPQQVWEEHYAEGRGFGPLDDTERALFAEHAPAPDGGRALDLGCGTGELAAYLASIGYRVDAADFASSAIDRARTERGDIENVRWLHLDIERDGLEQLSEDSYDLITLRLVVAFLRDRTRILRFLAERLRPGGAIVVITPTAENTPPARRGIALSEDEIGQLSTGWKEIMRLAVGELAVLILRGPSVPGQRRADNNIRPDADQEQPS